MTKKFVLHFLAIAALGLQLYCLIGYKEIYPFSSFPMYKGRLNEYNHFVCEVFVLDKNQNIIPYRKVGRATIDYFFRFNFCDNPQKAQQIIDQRDTYQAELERIAQEYIHGLSPDHQKQIKKIILKANYWDHFNFQTMLKPTREFILHEAVL